jgi:4-nitrophenyl phosphatase
MTKHSTLLSSLRHLVIDLDGVLYRGNEALPGTREFISFLREQEVSFVLATNNATMTPQQYVDKLSAMDVRVFGDEILTSSQATASYLSASALPGTRVFVIGLDGLTTALRDAGFVLVEDNAEYVVVGHDFTISYERLAQAALHIRAGATFIGTNPDRTFPSEQGILPGAGSLLAFLEAATDVSPTVIGKPKVTMMEQALARMGATPSTTAMIGDRLDTDILAGKRAGLTTLLVMSGVTDQETLNRSEIQPDLVFRDIGHLWDTWREVVDG